VTRQWMYVASLPKCNFFHALRNTPFFADLANDRFVFGGHRPIPSPSP